MKLQFLSSKVFLMGFKLKEIVFLTVLSSLGITKLLDYTLSFMRLPSPCIFCHFWQAQTWKPDGEICFNFTIMRGCVIATNYIGFSFSSVFCHHRVISLTWTSASNLWYFESDLPCENAACLLMLFDWIWNFKGFGKPQGQILNDREWEKSSHRFKFLKERDRILRDMHFYNLFGLELFTREMDAH